MQRVRVKPDNVRKTKDDLDNAGVDFKYHGVHNVNYYNQYAVCDCCNHKMFSRDMGIFDVDCSSKDFHDIIADFANPDNYQLGRSGVPKGGVRI